MTSSTATPNAPTNIAASADGADEIHITWSAPTWPGTSAITKYEVQWGSSDSGPWTTVGEPTGAGITHSELNASTTYHYQERAVNTSGPGTWSGTARNA